MRVRAVDGARLQNVQSLAGGDTGSVIDEDDSADALVSRERMSGRATQFSGSDDANGRHESVEYSSAQLPIHNSKSNCFDLELDLGSRELTPHELTHRKSCIHYWWLARDRTGHGASARVERRIGRDHRH